MGLGEVLHHHQPSTWETRSKKNTCLGYTAFQKLWNQPFLRKIDEWIWSDSRVDSFLNLPEIYRLYLFLGCDAKVAGHCTGLLAWATALWPSYCCQKVPCWMPLMRKVLALEFHGLFAKNVVESQDSYVWKQHHNHECIYGCFAQCFWFAKRKFC